MRNGPGQLLETTLPIGNLGAEQVLMVIVQCLTLQIFVRSVSEGHGSPCQDIVGAKSPARLPVLELFQGGALADLRLGGRFP